MVAPKECLRMFGLCSTMMQSSPDCFRYILSDYKWHLPRQQLSAEARTFIHRNNVTNRINFGVVSQLFEAFLDWGVRPKPNHSPSLIYSNHGFAQAAMKRAEHLEFLLQEQRKKLLSWSTVVATCNSAIWNTPAIPLGFIRGELHEDIRSLS